MRPHTLLVSSYDSHTGQFSIFTCPFPACNYGKARSWANLETHLNRHYSRATYRCPTMCLTVDPEDGKTEIWVQCSCRSPDRANLFRHRKKVHGYVPSKRTSAIANDDEGTYTPRPCIPTDLPIDAESIVGPSRNSRTRVQSVDPYPQLDIRTMASSSGSASVSSGGLGSSSIPARASSPNNILPQISGVTHDGASSGRSTPVSAPPQDSLVNSVPASPSLDRDAAQSLPPSDVPQASDLSPSAPNTVDRMRATPTPENQP